MAGILFLLLMMVLYVVYQVAMSLNSGWYRLEKLYRTPVRMSTRIGAGPICMNDDRPNGYLRVWVTLTPTQGGLHLEMPWYLSLMFPPLLIPWKDFAFTSHNELKSENTQVMLTLRDGDKLTVMRDEYLGMEPYLVHLPRRPKPAPRPAPSARIA